MRTSRPLLLIAVALAAMVLIWSADFYTEWLWFDSVGYLGVLQRQIASRLIVFAVAFIFTSVFLIGNLRLARSRARWSGRASAPGYISFDRWGRLQLASDSLHNLLQPVGLLLGLLFALTLSAQWQAYLAFFNQHPFGQQDPLFGADIAFFVFQIPVFSGVLRFLAVLTVLTMSLVFLIYLGRALRGLAPVDGRISLEVPVEARTHLAVLGAFLFLLIAAGVWLSTYELVYSSRGVTVGAGFTDVNVRLPVLRLLTLVSAALGISLIWAAVRNSVRLPLAILGAWALVFVIGNVALPFIVQQTMVAPNELAREREYIEHNIRLTRLAYGLHAVEEVEFPAEEAPTAQDIRDNPLTVNNIRLWDHRPLLDTYNQLQAIRGYYEFGDVDIDRYEIDGNYRQVMLSARELNPSRLAREAQTWQSLHLQYTHGYGLTMSPVNEITGEGLPNLFLRDVPPVGKLEVTRPEIYFGEKTDSYVITNTRVPEFDYPSGDQNVFGHYEGKGGVELGSPLNRLAFAVRFGESNMVLSTLLTSDSQILFHRNVRERINLIAPFLLLDHDPYLVLNDGRIFWVQDAYTHSDAYPYAQFYRGDLNYLRNSVKVIVDAYEGSVDFYLLDETDPLARTYASAYPGLFKSSAELPAGMREHLRYPEDLFLVQTEMYRTYHMQDPQVFYLREDQWQKPKEIYEDKEVVIDPYYVIMKLAGEEREEFLLMMPMTPPARNNVTAWLAARSDGDEYGKLLVYKYPKDRLVYGPLQVEGRISQDPTISAQFALWNQAGSRVIRGNMMMVPIGNSNIYVEPVYLLADRGTLPELKRVVVTVGDRIAMDATLSGALAQLFSLSGTPSRPSQPPPAGGTSSWPELSKQANELYDQAQSQIAQGDWAGYGESMRQLKAVLVEMSRMPAN